MCLKSHLPINSSAFTVMYTKHACAYGPHTCTFFSHILPPSAQQVWHFAPNVIFQPISSIIALLIFKNALSVSLVWECRGMLSSLPTGNPPVRFILHTIRKQYARLSLSIWLWLSGAWFELIWSLVSLVNGINNDYSWTLVGKYFTKTSLTFETIWRLHI